MLYQELHWLNKSEFPTGEWNTEPDKIQWVDKKTNLPCLIVRNYACCLCGYVGVNSSHPFYEKHYNEFEDYLKIHGGVNYAKGCSWLVCHVVEEEEDDSIWWIGFDCGHAAQDIIPKQQALDIEIFGKPIAEPYATYKNVEYVKAECESLAEQLLNLK